MAHWSEATAEHNIRPLKINANTIADIVHEHNGGPICVHIVGSNFASGKPGLLVLEKPDVLIACIQWPG